MVPWFMIQANTNGNGNDYLMCRPPTVLLENGSMVHDSNEHELKMAPWFMIQTNMNGNGNDHLKCRTPYCFAGE